MHLRLNYYSQKLSEWFFISDIYAIDIIEIFLISIIIYRILLFIKNTRAYELFKGIVVLMSSIVIAALFNMQTVLWIAKTIANIVAIALIIIFQPELRRALERLGKKKYIKSILPNLFYDNNNILYFSDNMKNIIADVVYEMGHNKIGALIVLELNNSLNEYINTGIMLDSLVSKQLIINIFSHNTPLHDGALIIKNDRIIAATCYLPLSHNYDNIDKKFGTRHRSALGLSEITDAISIVVSEETGQVSIAYNSNMQIDVTKEELFNYLTEVQIMDKAIIFDPIIER